jgi:hypothetical protein
MRKLVVGLAVCGALGLIVPRPVRAVDIDSKATKITITGRIQPMWSTSSIDNGDPSNEFLIRRARMALKLKVNDWVGGMVEPDFGEGKIALKDAYFKVEPNEHLELIGGQTKRRFDLFELTSSTQILVIERDGRIGRVKVPTYSFLTETLQYSDRDIGAFVLSEVADERIRLEGAITNGAGANNLAQVGEKAFSGRISVSPVKERDFMINAGISTHPFLKQPAVNDDTGNGIAFEASLEYGNFKSGPHVQAGFVTGDNWQSFSVVNDDSPTFNAVQGIVTYKGLFANPHWFEAWEPLLRVSWADPNGDVDNDGGVMVTPGFNLFLVNRTRLSANADIFAPEANDNPATPIDESETAVGVKLATWLYF